MGKTHIIYMTIKKLRYALWHRTQLGFQYS